VTNGNFAAPGCDLQTSREQLIAQRLNEVNQRNASFYDEEVEKLERWSDDLKAGLEREIKEIDVAIRDARKRSVVAATLKDKLEFQRQMRDLEQTRKEKRKKLYDDQDVIDDKRGVLIDDLERQLKQTHSVESLFTISWTIV